MVLTLKTAFLQFQYQSLTVLAAEVFGLLLLDLLFVGLAGGVGVAGGVPGGLLSLPLPLPPPLPLVLALRLSELELLDCKGANLIYRIE